MSPIKKPALLKLTSINKRNHTVNYIDNITKKGDCKFAAELFDSDLYDCFSSTAKREIAFEAGAASKSTLPSFKSNGKIRSNYYYFIFIALYALIYFCSNITGSTLVNIGEISGIKLIAPAAIFIYAFTFLVDSVITEIYGMSAARQTYTIIAFVSIILLVLLYLLSLAPTKGQNYIHTAFFSNNHNVIRVFIVSFITFLISQFINSTIINKIKYRKYTRNNYTKASAAIAISCRFILASSISTLMDSIIFCFGVFYLIVPTEIIINIVITQYIIKLLYDIVFSLISSNAAKKIKASEQIDIVEYTKPTLKNIFNIVSLKKDFNNISNMYPHHDGISPQPKPVKLQVIHNDPTIK
jgi:hypothetical protein